VAVGGPNSIPWIINAAGQIFHGSHGLPIRAAPNAPTLAQSAQPNAVPTAIRSIVPPPSTTVTPASKGGTDTVVSIATLVVSGPSPSAAKTYTIVAGDNPQVIAAKLGVPLALRTAWSHQLLALNNASAKGLQLGQVPKLPPPP
jgi:LysM repeat protein